MFEVGKEVLCIKSHSRGYVRKGQKFTVNGIRKGPCSCVPIMLDVGVRSDAYFVQTVCAKCRARDGEIRTDRIRWIGARLFAPIDNSLSDNTIEQVLTEVEQCYQTV